MSELGTIGLLYENRKNKKQGKLVSIDEKYKTMTMESEDGSSFNISFATFKSGWRQVKDSTEVPVATPVENAVAEEKSKKEKKEKKPKKESAGKATKKEKAEKKPARTHEESEAMRKDFRNETDAIVKEFLDGFNSKVFTVKINVAKNRYEILANGRAFIHLYMSYLKRRHRVFMKTELYRAVDWTEKSGISRAETTIFENYSLPTSFYMSADNLAGMLHDMQPVIEEVLVDLEEKAKAKEEKKAKKEKKEKAEAASVEEATEAVEEATEVVEGSTEAVEAE